jgi:hypothetical protein
MSKRTEKARQNRKVANAATLQHMAALKPRNAPRGYGSSRQFLSKFKDDRMTEMVAQS